jgi:GNAT superfamily N-acetyltransferase
MEPSIEESWAPRRGPLGLALRVLHRLGVRRRYLLIGGADDPLEESSAIPVEPETLAPCEVDEYLAFRPSQAREVIQRRLDEGGICFVGRSEGRLVAALWVACGSVRLDYVPCRLWLGEHTFFLHDLYVEPSLRGKRVAEPVTRLRKRTLADAGYRWKVALYEPENRAAIRRARRRGNRPLAFLTCWRLGPFRWQRVEPLVPEAPRLVGVASGARAQPSRSQA